MMEGLGWIVMVLGVSWALSHVAGFVLANLLHMTNAYVDFFAFVRHRKEFRAWLDEVRAK